MKSKLLALSTMFLLLSVFVYTIQVAICQTHDIAITDVTISLDIIQIGVKSIGGGMSP